VNNDLRRIAERIALELSARDRAVPSAPAERAPAGAGDPTPAASMRIAAYIDHTLLRAEATAAEIDRLCDEALAHRFAAVCVNGAWTARCAARLAGSGVAVAPVVGFPLGASTTATKAFEAREARADGAGELDMVAALGQLKGADWRYVHDDIAAVVAAAAGAPVKVIIESAALTPVEIIRASAIAIEAGAAFVKTSTGFHPAGGASAEAVALMRLVVGDRLGVKASGGVRDCATALRMIASGATRIGTSSGVAMAECLGTGPLPVRDLLGAAREHPAHCRTCAPGAARIPAAY
jgi:deoxyribose-phosphate aldolase